MVCRFPAYELIGVEFWRPRILGDRIILGEFGNPTAPPLMPGGLFDFPTTIDNRLTSDNGEHALTAHAWAAQLSLA